jgi:hypothetical protein
MTQDLTGQQLRQLRDALLDAFPKKSDLEQLLWFYFKKNLDAIAGGSNLEDTTFNLIMRAKSEGWLEDLIRAARLERPGNLKLQTWEREVQSSPISMQHSSVILLIGGGLLVILILILIFTLSMHPTVSPGPSPKTPPSVAVVPSAPTHSQTPTLPGLIANYTLDFGDGTCVDLDVGYASLKGNADEEICLDFGRFFFDQDHNTWAKTQVVYIPDSQASYQGCANGTLIQREIAFMDRVQQDQSICVATSKGNWAVMKIKDAKSSSSGLGYGDITFDVKLFRPLTPVPYTSVPATSAVAASVPVLNPTPTVPGLITSYTLDFGDGTCVDLDTKHASLKGNADEEICLDFGRFFFGEDYNTWADTQVVYIPDSQASYQGCANGTLIQQGVAFMDRVQQDQSICVATSKGNWAVMKIKDAKSSSSGLGYGDITFDVRLFQP